MPLILKKKTQSKTKKESLSLTGSKTVGYRHITIHSYFFFLKKDCSRKYVYNVFSHADVNNLNIDFIKTQFLKIGLYGIKEGS